MVGPGIGGRGALRAADRPNQTSHPTPAGASIKYLVHRPSSVIHAGLVLGLAFSGLGYAEDAAKKMEMPKPGPEHKKLGYFVGNWTTDGDMKPGPMGPGGKMTDTDHCSWFDGGYAVVCKGAGNGVRWVR